MPIIESLAGREVLDSRGRPTVLARCTLRSGAVGSASVPSGASTGQAEAVERRDGDPRRYGGLGCRLAARSIGEVFLPALDAISNRVASQNWVSSTACSTVKVSPSIPKK